MQEVFHILEWPWSQSLTAQTEEKEPLQVPQKAWQGLQCATALRRLLHPSKHIPKKSQVSHGALNPPDGIAGPPYSCNVNGRHNM